MTNNENSKSIGEFSDIFRISFFAGLQFVFLLGSPFAGGFHKAMWSMADSALLILSLGFTGLVMVLSEERWRKAAYRVAIGIYILAVVDMAANIMITGYVGWAKPCAV